MVRREFVRFWGLALAVALVYAAVIAFAFPYGRLGLVTAADRHWGWLVSMWSGGVLAVLFGLSGVLGWASGIGFRDVVRAGSMKAAMQARREAREAARTQGRYSNFGWWLVATGLIMIGIYFIGWLVLG